MASSRNQGGYGHHSNGGAKPPGAGLRLARLPEMRIISLRTPETAQESGLSVPAGTAAQVWRAAVRRHEAGSYYPTISWFLWGLVLQEPKNASFDFFP